METVREIFNVLEPTIWSAVGVLVVWLIGKLLAKMSADATFSAVCDALRQGVDKAQEDLVVWAKRANEDGKLTADERKEAMQIAYNHAKSVLTGAAGKLLMSWGWEKVQSIIKQYVEKKKAAETKTTIVEVSNVDSNPASATTAAAQGAPVGGSDVNP